MKKPDANPTRLRLERVRSKLSNALSTISVAHLWASKSASKHTCIHQKHVFGLFLNVEKTIQKPLFWNILSFLKYDNTYETDGAKEKIS